MEVLHSNLNHLVHIKLKEKKLSERYTKHYPAKEKRLFGLFQAEPEMWSGESCIVYDKITEKRLNEYGYTIDADRKVWAQPEVRLWFSDSRNSIDYQFATNEEATKFRDDILKLCAVEGNLINLRTLKTTKE